MFDNIHLEEESSPKPKTIFIMLNGKPDDISSLKFTKPPTKQEIFRKAESYWLNFRCNKTFRIFGTDGVELFDEDLLFLKDGDRLYLSRGEDFDSNRNFGEYEIVKLLGEGGFGSVSLAKSRITNELMAIKIMKPSKSTSSLSIDMIFKEAEYLKSLSHPHIVRILNCYALKNMRFVVVMEYLEGGELKELLKRKEKFTEQEARYYFKQIISAVSYCHRQGIVHRDLKLENILLTTNNQVKVTDFGISGVVENFNPSIDWGTLKYMPPEILSRKEKVNAFSGDVWACGIILYYMVEGCLPFTGSSSLEITKAIINNEVEYSQKSSLSNNCKILISKMLEKDPKKRVTFFDVQISPWLNREIEEEKKVDEGNSDEGKILKKTSIKSRKLPKQNTVFIPKRLQKERNFLAQQLEGYRMSRKFYRSEAKGFPSLKSSEYKKSVKMLSQVKI